MSKRHWIMRASAGIALLLASCAAPRPNTQSATQAAPSPQAFADPIVPAKPLTLPPVKITGMIPSTQPAERTSALMTVAASNRDPFAAIGIPTNLKAVIQSAPAKPIVTKPPVVRSQPAPQPTISLNPTPNLNSTPMPPISVSPLPALQPALPPVLPPSLPPVSRTNLAEVIALTGVIQTGSNLSAIVQDTDGTPRYVQIGDTLAGGQVTVKRINVNSAGLPSIVLQQNGVDFIRTVGSTEGSVAQAL